MGLGVAPRDGVLAGDAFEVGEVPEAGGGLDEAREVMVAAGVAAVDGVVLERPFEAVPFDPLEGRGTDLVADDGAFPQVAVVDEKQSHAH